MKKKNKIINKKMDFPENTSMLFRLAFEYGPIGMSIVTFDRKYLKVNKALCDMVGYSAEELEKMSYLDITHPEDREKNIQLAEMKRRGRISGYQLEKRYIKKNNEIIWVRSTTANIHDEKGLPIYGLAMLEDITERKKMAQKMIQQEKLAGMGKLVACIAHELNNPLTAIINYLDVILSMRGAISNTKRNELMKSIKTVALGMRKTIEDMLCFSTTSSIGKKTLNINDLISKTIKLEESRLSGIRLELKLKTIPPYLADEERMMAVLKNLMDNSIYALKDKDNRHIIIHTDYKKKEACIRITFEDNGCGIDTHIMDSIFDPFFTTKEFNRGTGLGLSIVKMIINDHGGEISAASQKEIGTKFVISLPVVN